jgi:hypothetical protein
VGEKMKDPVIAQEVAVGLLRMLSGSPGYPFHPEGEIRAAAVLRECCVSVGHARRTVEEFEGDFPTLEQIRSVAFRLREEFEPRKPEPEPKGDGGEFANSILQKMQLDMDEHWRKDKEMWAKIKTHLKVAEFSGVDWLEIARAKLDLGYELTPDERERLTVASSL